MEDKICPVYKKCGGCQLMNMDYSSQLKFKQKKINTFLDCFVKPEYIIGMENPYHYRCKVQAAFQPDSHGRIISGVYQSSSHRVVNVNSCLLEDKIADSIITSIRRLLTAFKLSAYSERTERGLLRHVLIRRGFNTGEVMVVLVTTTHNFPSKNAFIKKLLEEHPEITTIIMNVNAKFTSLVLGKEEKILYGKGYIEDTLCGLRFKISAASFYQINPVQTEILYSKAIEYAELTGKENVLDAYCGVGTIGLIASNNAKNVIGVELNKAAVRDAIGNAKINNILNSRFYAGDAGDFMVDAMSDGIGPDVLFMDPPRSGSSEKFLNSALIAMPKKIVYVSCNPETLARDLKLLAKKYNVRNITPVDMFPHTNHVECVAQLTAK